MANVLTIGIHGETAQVAYADLAKVPGLTVTTTPTSDEVSKSLDPLTLTATILGIAVSGFKLADEIAGLAQEIVDWFKKRKEVEPTMRATLEFPDGTRLLLEDATAEDIALALKALPRKEA